MQVTRSVVCAGFNGITNVSSEQDKSKEYIPFW